MTQREKRLEKARNNPKNVTFDDLVTLLESYGFQRTQGQGSHFVYRYSQGGLTLKVNIVYRKPQVKSIYVEQVVELIDHVKGHTGD